MQNIEKLPSDLLDFLKVKSKKAGSNQPNENVMILEETAKIDLCPHSAEDEYIL